jgi:hypothetical protein
MYFDGVAFGYVYPNHKPLPYRALAETASCEQLPILSITSVLRRASHWRVFDRKRRVFDRKARVSGRKFLATSSKQEGYGSGFEHNLTSHVFS